MPAPLSSTAGPGNGIFLAAAIALQLLIASEVSGEPAHHEQEAEQDPTYEKQRVHGPSL
jgi:hypothetical protein